MAITSMKRLLRKAKDERYAIAAINIFNHLTARAVIRVAEELSSPVILQTSPGTVKFYGATELANMLMPMAEKTSVPVVIHLDHCTETSLAMDCLNAGWTSIMFDGSHLPLRENIKATRGIVKYAYSYDASVEGELGTIAGVEEDIVINNGNEALVNLDDAIIFVKETGIDAFAPAIGTNHGLYKNSPKINFNLFSDIVRNIDCPCVVHGGTGLDDNVFEKLILLGATKINISTAIKIAYTSGFKKTLTEDNLNPLKLDKYVSGSVESVVKKHLLLFGSAQKTDGIHNDTMKGI